MQSTLSHKTITCMKRALSLSHSLPYFLPPSYSFLHFLPPSPSLPHFLPPSPSLPHFLPPSYSLPHFLPPSPSLPHFLPPSLSLPFPSFPPSFIPFPLFLPASFPPLHPSLLHSSSPKLRISIITFDDKDHVNVPLPLTSNLTKMQLHAAFERLKKNLCIGNTYLAPALSKVNYCHTRYTIIICEHVYSHYRTKGLATLNTAVTSLGYRTFRSVDLLQLFCPLYFTQQ